MIIPLQMIRRLRISELELAGGDFRWFAQNGPVAQRPPNVGGSQGGEDCARRVGEPELKRTLPKLRRICQNGGRECGESAMSFHQPKPNDPRMISSAPNLLV